MRRMENQILSLDQIPIYRILFREGSTASDYIGGNRGVIWTIIHNISSYSPFHIPPSLRHFFSSTPVCINNSSASVGHLLKAFIFYLAIFVTH